MLELDSDHFPLIVARWRGLVDAAEAEQFIRWYQGMIDRAQRENLYLVSVSDSRAGATMGSTERKRMVDWMNALSLERQRVTTGVFVVVESAVGRGILMAFKWMSSSPTMKKTEICATLQEAYARACDAFEAVGQAAPRELLRA
jgi:hypothetical protein